MESCRDSAKLQIKRVTCCILAGRNSLEAILTKLKICPANLKYGDCNCLHRVVVEDESQKAVITKPNCLTQECKLVKC